VLEFIIILEYHTSHSRPLINIYFFWQTIVVSNKSIYTLYITVSIGISKTSLERIKDKAICMNNRVNFLLYETT